jgi:glycine cleavage system H protein
MAERAEPAGLKYAPTHEWAESTPEGVVVGITRFAVDQLTDITYLELPKVGKAFAAGAEFGVIESVKSTSPLYAPIAGTVVAVNDAAAKDNSLINTDPYGAGWLLKLQLAPDAKFDHLLTKAQYDAQVAGH